MFPPLLEERKRLLHQKRREKAILGREQIIADRDLVAITLSNNRDEILRYVTLRRAVLGQTAYPFGEDVFVKLITNGAFSSYVHLIAAATKPNDGRLPAFSDIFKLIICDARCLEKGAHLQNAYDAELRE
ncbi:hypothetical protein Ct61P_05511 [Colletotrichum tofieldiae]|nr:hypothetical protein Ct61P_05511 [Colletotrichum tofieldiae]